MFFLFILIIYNKSFISFIIFVFVLSKFLSIFVENHAAKVCHHPPKCLAIFSTSVFLDLRDHFILSHSFLRVIITFGQSISCMIVSP